MKNELVDPADKVKKEKEEKEVSEEMKSFDVDELSVTDFKAIPDATAQSVHPFEGYPMKPGIKIGASDISATYIVALRPDLHVHQDPSGENKMSAITKGKKKGRMRKVTYIGTHSHVVVDHEGGGDNLDVVFANIIKVKDGEMRCAVVYSHSARAQLVFKTNPATGKMGVDGRYLLLDSGQKNLLRKLYLMIHSSQANVERLSKAISGESDEMLEEIPETGG